jgi:MFS family permease
MINYNIKKLLFLISLGSTLEYYDFALFIFLAPLVGKNLIPINNPQINLLVSYLIFTLGAFMRPLGGLIFGHIGDIKGRKYTFVFTILFMGIPTFIIGVIPNIQIIGLWATFLLVACRVLQGFATGGEIAGSITFGYEVPTLDKYRAFSASIVIFGVNVGFFLASLISAIILNHNIIPNIENWRLAFMLGGMFGILSYILRKELVESPAFANYQRSLVNKIIPIKELCQRHYTTLLWIFPLFFFIASMLAVFTFYMPVYLNSFYHFPLATLLKFNTYGIFIMSAGSLISGIFYKYINKQLIIAISIILIVLIPILFFSYSNLTLNDILMINAIVIFVLGMLCGKVPGLCGASFPIQVRYTGCALVYNISFGIIAGMTQPLLVWLIHITQLIWIPGVYIALFGILMLILIKNTPKHKFVVTSN